MAYAFEGIDIIVQDESFTGIEQLTGYFLVQAITERGVPNTPYIIENEPAFKRVLGTPIHASGKEIVRGLSLGAKFVVFPVHDYTDQTDAATIVGVLATGDIGAVTFKGKTVGPGYNGVVVTVELPISGAVGKFDIVETLGTIVTKRKTNVPALLTADMITEINNEMELINIPIAEVGATLTAGTITLATGARDITLISNADIIGSATNSSGISAFDKDPLNTLHILNIIKQDVAIDAAYVTYAENTLRTVHGFTLAGSAQATVLTYESTAPKSMHYRLVTGGASIPDPTNKNIYFASIGAGDLAAAIAKKDAIGIHYSTAEARFSRFQSDVKNVLVNFYGNAAIAAKPINRIVNDGGVIKYFGNDNTLLDRSSILKSEDVSDFVILLQRQLVSIAKLYQFKKNNRKELWAPIYRNVRTIMEEWVRVGALQGEEGIGWAWSGDQDANNLTELTYNTATDINNRIFKAQLVLIPTTAAEEIKIAMRVQSGTSVSVAIV